MIPYFDYRPAHRRIRTEIDAAIRRVLDSGRLILDAEGRAFEEEFAAWTGIPHAVAVASGTDALILALRALDVGRDDEVITVCNAGVPPVAAIRAVGATPRFVDVHFRSLMKDPVETLRVAYANMGRELGEEHAARIRKYLAEKPRGKFGVHRYTPEEWGFEAAELRRRLAPYTDHYGIEIEV